MIETVVKEKKDCTGCYSCVVSCNKNCISMIADDEGFWYPKTDNSNCIKCGRCIECCPIINKTVVNNNPIALACINKDESVRRKSSSGGIFSLVAEQVLENSGIVFGARFNKNFEVEHSFIDSKEDIGKLRGSKYVQSRIGDTFRQAKTFLDRGKHVVFVGTPCQIGGLKSFLPRAYNNLFCMDMICHGVPSPVVWKKYLKYRERKNGASVKSVSFRYKKFGWTHTGTFMIFENNTHYFQSMLKDLFMRSFLKDTSLRPSCYDCKFKTLHRQSDFTLADFWGVQNILADMDDDKGTSLVFINTDKGKAMLEKIKEKMICKEVDLEKAVEGNPSAIQSAPFNPYRSDFFRELNSKSINHIISKYCIDKTHVRVLRVIKRVAIKFGVRL